MLQLSLMMLLVTVTQSVPIRMKRTVDDNFWYDMGGSLWEVSNKLTNSLYYNTYKHMNGQMDMYGFAQHAGKINRGRYQASERNKPSDRVYGAQPDFNPKDIKSGPFVQRPQINPCDPDPCKDKFENLEATCTVVDDDTAKCEEVINGHWSAWGPYGLCQSVCTKARHRSCTDPAPSSNGGLGCVGQAEEILDCGDGLCLPIVSEPCSDSLCDLEKRLAPALYPNWFRNLLGTVLTQKMST